MRVQPIIHHLFVSEGHDFYGRHGKGRKEFPINDHDEIELVAGKGIVGDRFFDYKEDYKGQITFFDLAVYEAVKSEFALPELDVSVFRRNAVVSGMDLNGLIGETFQIGDCEFEGTQEAKPCYWMDQACAPGVEEFLKGRGGLRCRILKGGIFAKQSFAS
ncbi:MAG: MOSC domain-containing protein [Akkermansiaceae bacterium]|jgi:MOSC domain-containing protein YiiM|tara:strand:+ start:4797 stop:5276 length:480 start_codon:yes stop_codon:yes gene_type:complete